jgi:tetratricopeptide (TPR) repeat protein
MSDPGSEALAGWEAVHVDDLDAIPVAEGVVWRPVRRRLGVRAFGVNAYTSEGGRRHIVEEHDELGGGAGGHEELYVVVRGRATFTIDGETLDAPAGTIVFVRDPALKRVAIAEDEGTVVLAVGGEPGRAYEVSPWEHTFTALPLLRAGRWEEAIAVLEEGLRDHPQNASLLYNLACAESQAGRTVEAVRHLQEAVRINPDYRENARTDKDFDPIRREPGFPA